MSLPWFETAIAIFHASSEQTGFLSFPLRPSVLVSCARVLVANASTYHGIVTKLSSDRSF
jgi:hypothetical protein